MMKFLASILVFGVVLGGLYGMGMIGPPAFPLDTEEIQQLKTAPLQSIDQSMGVSQAYRAIPHKQVTFSSNKSVLTREEAKYLEKAFSFVDLAVVERVTLMRTLKRKGNRPLRLDNYDQILKRLLALDVPTGLGYFHQQVMASIVEEQDYYRSLQDRPSVTVVDRRHALIQQAHHRLMASHKFLIERYPEESRSNYQAFYEHLCALDFI